jgi:TatA/E family protein of Tat protein translocase
MNDWNAQRPYETNNIRDFLMPNTIASIMNLMGPDLMVILLIVLLLFGAKKLPELAPRNGSGGKRVQRRSR